MPNPKLSLAELAAKATQLDTIQKAAIDAALNFDVWEGVSMRPFDEEALDRNVEKSKELHQASDDANTNVVSFWSNLDDDTVDALKAHMRKEHGNHE